jgi:ADP-heptose:LPS heptosyltransferase
MGDVALTVPVIRGILNENPTIYITLVTKKAFIPFFEGIERLHVIPADFKKRHKGFPGLFRLFSQLREQTKSDLVIDLHSVLRSKILSFLFRISGKKVVTIKKDRKRKEQFTRSAEVPALPHTVSRYTDVIHRAGIPLSKAMEPPVFELPGEKVDFIRNYLIRKGLDKKILIGIAPFARHTLKIWPLENVKKLIAFLLKTETVHIFLFGGGKHELNVLNDVASGFKECSVVELHLEHELALMRKLSVMVSMDSGNMHLAALSGIPTISIWGATHPGIGFGSWHQPDSNSIQISKEELPCRPCTVYGKGTCYRGDFACMNRITPEQVARQVKLVCEQL